MVDTADHVHDDSASSSSSGGGGGSSIGQRLSPEGIPLVSGGGSSSSSSTAAPAGSLDAQQRQQAQQQQQQQQSSPHHLRFVLSPKPTPAAQLLVQRRLAALPEAQRQQYSNALEVRGSGCVCVSEAWHACAQRVHRQAVLRLESRLPHAYGHPPVHPPTRVQVGAQAMACVESLARRIAASGGAALLVDYGADRPFENSLAGACHTACEVVCVCMCVGMG
jgi:hypothetical protein